MRLWRSRRFETRLDRAECEHRVWLLNGTSLPNESRGRFSCFVSARAGEAGFEIWTVVVSYAGGMRESTITLRGRLTSNATGTAVEIWYAPRPWIVGTAAAPLFVLLLLAMLRSFRYVDYRSVAGDHGSWVVAATLLALVVVCAIAAAEMVADTLGELLTRVLKDDSAESGHGSGRSSNARSPRRPIRWPLGTS